MNFFAYVDRQKRMVAGRRNEFLCRCSPENKSCGADREAGAKEQKVRFTFNICSDASERILKEIASMKGLNTKEREFFAAGRSTV